ncbi:peptidoglycan DD-metalloendopeptidase family protein [Undibacterium arcticum]|uniref:Peptidoglycan DD-metalloendopeptidase family protein n=1 Tax=Undibacterium arcticum TaxID=1762892 RepID=A0ABV7F4Y9_9BURK
MKKIRLACVVLSAAVLAACGTTRNSAPVVDRPAGGKTSETAKSTAKVVDSHGNYTVKKGDTLYRIALDQGQSYRDIIAWNNLNNPNDIKVDQVLRVLPPEAGASGNGAQTAAVSGSGVEVRSLSNGQPSAQPAAAAGAPQGPYSNKAGPRGDKRPYSDSALAELQKPDTGGATVVAKFEPPKPIESKPAEKPADSAPAGADDEAVAWMWPADGKVIAGFDDAKSKGIDISGKLGQQVLAAGAGKVMYAGSGIRGYGNLVIVKHTNNLLSAYAHNKAILVKEGQSVSKGQKIAEMGNSDSDAVKLHFEIRQQGKPVDPSKFLPNR